MTMDPREIMNKDETLRLRNRHIGDSCTLFFKSDPLKIVRAEGQFMYDEQGQKYLDCINNVCHVGHCHPDVVKACCDQMATLNTNSRFLHDNLVICAEKLTSLLPEPLSVCFFVNSGSEANDLALLLARKHTGHQDIVVVDNAYHGHLTTLMDISPYKFKLPGADGKKDWVHVAESPDCYRGKYTRDDYLEEELGHLYAEEVRLLCKQMRDKGRTIAAFIAEPLLSCGGQIIPPSNYLRLVYKHIKEVGGVCIADEVQTGFGRVGKHWWGFQLQGEDVCPDIVTVGKAMGNGHPVAAVITTKEISESFYRTGVSYFNTYGGNPVSCAVATAVMDVIEKQNLRENAARVGNHLLTSLRQIAPKHPLVGDVRGVGLFVGVELVKDRVTKEPATVAAHMVLSRMKDEKILLSVDGYDGNVLKFKPPMVFSMENVDHVVKLLDKTLTEVAKSLPREETRNIDSTAYSISEKEITLNGIKSEAKISRDETGSILVK